MRLHVHNLHTRFLRGITFELKTPQNLTILGFNGAGKTTLAKALTGLLENESCRIDRTPVARLSAKTRARALNYVPAALEVFDEYISVEEYLRLSVVGANSGEVERVMAQVGIAHLAKSGTSVLSSGEAGLLLFASAMLHGARFTVFDEPTANLDSDKKIAIYSLLRNSPLLHSKLVITHDLNLAFALGYPILFLDGGKQLFYGECETFFTPDTLRGFFGDSIKRVGDYFAVAFS